MKTKKNEKVSLIYLMSILVIFASSLYVSSIFVKSIFWIWGIALCCIGLLLYTRYVHVKHLLFVDFEKYLQIKIQAKDWPNHVEFPLRDDIKKWMDNYSFSVEIGFSKTIWDKIMGETNVRIENILKRLVVPVMGVEQGISLYNLYELPKIDGSEVNAGNTTKESQEMGAYIEYLPAGYLIACLDMPMELTSPVLYRLFIRQDKVGNFDTVCKALMKANCEISFSKEIIDILIAETSKPVPVGFSQKFLSYLVDQDYKNHPYFKEVTAIRRKVLTWWLEQKVKDFDFFDYWASLDPEEIDIIKKLLPLKQTFKIFEKMEVWSELSDEKMRGLFVRYIEYPEKIKDRSSFLYEYHQRF